MKILVLDNYDSFTYNLVHYIEAIIDCDVDVYRNDKISLDDVDNYDAIVLSPGPGIPEEAGILKPLIERYAATKKIFGVCLGMQAIGEVFGAKLLNTKKVYHGVATTMTLTAEKSDLFLNIPEQFQAGRYHSWIVANENLPDTLKVTAIDSENRIMALKHAVYNVQGVQFHPESVLTPYGKQIIENWLHN